MSTYYYAVCEDCREYCDAASSGGDHLLVDSPSTLSPFIACHGDCHNFRIKSDNVWDSAGYLRWTPATIEEYDCGDLLAGWERKEKRRVA